MVSSRSHHCGSNTAIVAVIAVVVIVVVVVVMIVEWAVNGTSISHIVHHINHRPSAASTTKLHATEHAQHTHCHVFLYFNPLIFQAYLVFMGYGVKARCGWLGRLIDSYTTGIICRLNFNSETYAWASLGDF